jgi:transposase
VHLQKPVTHCAPNRLTRRQLQQFRFVTDLSWKAVDVDEFHRAHAAGELGIRSWRGCWTRTRSLEPVPHGLRLACPKLVHDRIRGTIMLADMTPDDHLALDRKQADCRNLESRTPGTNSRRSSHQWALGFLRFKWTSNMRGTTPEWMSTMVTMERKKPRQRRSFTPEFKAEIVELCRSGERSIGQVARDFDLTETNVRNWVKQAEIDQGERPGLTTEEREELTKLRRENRSLREDVEILKRATAFFTEETR